MPLTDFQRTVVEVLRPFRTARSFVGGGVALNQRWVRLSDDMDLYRDDPDVKLGTIDAEIAALREAGLVVREEACEHPYVVEVIVRAGMHEGAAQTKIQWFGDPEICRRFFPVVEDLELGFRLSQADMAVNKVLCAARRLNAARDAIDLVAIAREYCPLGPLIWALSSKDESLTPVAAIRSIRKNAFSYSDDELRKVRTIGPEIGRDEVREIVGRALDEAGAYCERAPLEYSGFLFVDSAERPVAADGESVSAGSARPMQIRDFSGLAQLS